MGSEGIAKETYMKTNTVYIYSIGWWGGKQVLIDLNLPFRGVGSGVIARHYIQLRIHVQKSSVFAPMQY